MILTIGVAADANVVIFERIKEEVRRGKTVRSAVDSGYGRGFKTILDANVLTLLTALVSSCSRPPAQGLRPHADPRRPRQHVHRRPRHAGDARPARRLQVLRPPGVHGRQARARSSRMVGRGRGGRRAPPRSRQDRGAGPSSTLASQALRWRAVHRSLAEASAALATSPAPPRIVPRTSSVPARKKKKRDSRGFPWHLQLRLHGPQEVVVHAYRRSSSSPALRPVRAGGGNPVHGLKYGLEFKTGTRIARGLREAAGPGRRRGYSRPGRATPTLIQERPTGGTSTGLPDPDATSCDQPSRPTQGRARHGLHHRYDRVGPTSSARRRWVRRSVGRWCARR